MNSKLQRYLERASDDLPAMPKIASQVVRAVDDPNSSLEDVRKLIDQDPAIAARLLKIANSALYGFQSEIQNLGHAITLLGTTTVRNLVLTASMKATYTRFGLMEKLLWQHSALAGPVAGKLAQLPEIDLQPEDAFTAGLMHDIGKTALANSHRDKYEEVVQQVYNERVTFCEAEMEKFGFDHAELGACVAESWQLPDRLVSVIRNHHSPGKFARLPEDEARLTALTSITTDCLTRLGIGRREPAVELDLGTKPAWVFLDLTPDDVDRVLEICREQIKASESIIG